MAIRSERKRRKDGADSRRNETDGNDEGKLTTLEKKKRKGKVFLRRRKKRGKEKGKRKEEGKGKERKEISGPNSSLKQGKDNKNYEITKLPLNTNLGYYRKCHQ